MTAKTPGSGSYAPGYGDEVVDSFGARTVDAQLAFVVPYLRPGMTVLDCGCGPGSITCGIAERVRPGSVTGIDIDAGQVAAAAQRATDNGTGNAQFEVADVTDLPYVDAQFDAVVAHAVLQHLRDPGVALSEFHRVLKPGGLVALRDDDVGSLILAPDLPQTDRILDVINRVVRLGGGDPNVERRYRSLLRAAGFKPVALSTTADCNGTTEATTRQADLAAALLEHMAPTAIADGLAREDEMPMLIAGVRDWGRHPDAFDAIIWCEAIGWKAGEA